MMNENSEVGQRGKSHEDAVPFRELLTLFTQVGNQLSLSPSVYELCRQAVQIGLSRLGFERVSIWLVDSDKKLILGTFGTDEDGRMRDERMQQHSWDSTMRELSLLETPNIIMQQTQVPLFDDAHQVIGFGDIGSAALWNGEEVIGFLNMDNFLSRQPIRDEHWHIFELYALMLGQLLSLKRAELALRSKEELLHQILEIMPVGVFVLAPEERITRYNRVAQEIWGFQPEHLDSWSPEAVWLHNQRPVGKDEWAGRQALWYGDSVLNQEVEITRPDGTRSILLNSGVPLRDSAGVLTGAVIVNQDITESKRREMQLEALALMSKALRPLTGKQGALSMIIDQMGQLLKAEGVAIILDGGEGVATFDAAAGSFSPLAKMHLTQQLQDHQDETRSKLRVLDTQQIDALCIFQNLADVPAFTVIAPLIAEDGVMGAVLLGFAKPPDMWLQSMIMSLGEVAASAIRRGQLYDEMTTQANRLARVMETVNFGLLLLDPQHYVVLSNQQAQVKMAHLANVDIGEKLEELAGQKLSRFLPSSGTTPNLQEVQVNGLIYEISAVPVGTSGVSGGWLIVIHDVTRERAMQSSIQQHQRLAAVGQLAAGIAHDFNNIIAVILLYVQMLQRNPSLQENEQNRLQVIRDQAQNASKLIRQILDFSRQTVIERASVDLVALIRESILLWERTLPESIAIHFEDHIQAEANILADANSIQQALMNLAVNARDAMAVRGGELRVSVRLLVVGQDEAPPVAGLRRGKWFEVQVTDNGEGIASEHLPHIFDPFFTTKDIGKGTGLGLAQVYGIVQQHGGMLAAQSEVGQWTKIQLFLPAFVDDSTFLHEQELLDGSGEGNETILLVEDNAPAREATAALLEMLGYRVMAAADGRAGLELFFRNSDSIQLILTDLVMPEMGGLELYRQICPVNPSIGLLIMTGYPVEDERKLVADHEKVEWLQKPFTVKQLTSAVRRILVQGKSPHEE